MAHFQAGFDLNPVSGVEFGNLTATGTNVLRTRHS
jgi:hypothetical protein